MVFFGGVAFELLEIQPHWDSAPWWLLPIPCMADGSHDDISTAANSGLDRVLVGQNGLIVVNEFVFYFTIIFV